MSKKYENKAINAELIMVDFDTQVQKRNGGTYEGTTILYKAFGKPQDKSFTTKTFEFKPDLRGQLESLKPKDKFTLNLYREEGGQFWNVDSVTKGHTEQKRSSPSANTASQGSASFGGPNPAAVGQVLNLAVELGLIKSLDDLQDVNKARSVVAQVKAAKAAIAAVYDDDVKQEEQNQQAAQSHTPEPSGGFDDDLPF